MNGGRNSLVTAIGRVAWGYVFLYLNINLNEVNILPDWACYAFILAALPGLALAERSAALLRPLAWILLAAEGADWVLSLLGYSLSGGAFYIIGVIIAVVELYFHFQLLTNIAAVASRFDENRARGIRRLRNATAIFGTVMAIPWPIYRLGETAQETLAVALVVLALVLIVWTFAALFGLRGEIRRQNADTQDL